MIKRWARGQHKPEYKEKGCQPKDKKEQLRKWVKLIEKATSLFEKKERQETLRMKMNRDDYFNNLQIDALYTLLFIVFGMTKYLI